MRFAALLLVATLTGADCGGTACKALPVPMTVSRAETLDPSVTTGIAVSTTHVYGDCRPVDDPLAPPPTCDQSGPCARERQSMRVFLTPVNQSVPLSDLCPGGIAVSDLEANAAFAGRSSEDGELVASIAAGRFTLFVATDDRCAVCGLAGDAGACVVEITEGRITTRDLVLDRSSR
jgi:hypothetical protein